MSQKDVEFADLIKRIQGGDKDAAHELYKSYGCYILHAVRKRMHERLRSKFDSLDFVQDVWASFFADSPDKFDFAGPEDLINFLTTLARNKVAQATRTRMERQKYNIDREIRLDLFPQGGAYFPAAQRTPSEILMSQEEWEQFLNKQPLVYRRIFLLLRDGKSSATIADELRISQRTVNRVLTRLVLGSPP